MVSDGSGESSHLFDNQTKPPPMPPPGMVYQWEYAGYRNKDGTITPGKDPEPCAQQPHPSPHHANSRSLEELCSGAAGFCVLGPSHDGAISALPARACQSCLHLPSLLE